MCLLELFSPILITNIVCSVDVVVGITEILEPLVEEKEAGGEGSAIDANPSAR